MARWRPEELEEAECHRIHPSGAHSAADLVEKGVAAVVAAAAAAAAVDEGPGVVVVVARVVGGVAVADALAAGEPEEAAPAEEGMWAAAASRD